MAVTKGKQAQLLVERERRKIEEEIKKKKEEKKIEGLDIKKEQNEIVSNDKMNFNDVGEKYKKEDKEVYNKSIEFFNNYIKSKPSKTLSLRCSCCGEFFSETKPPFEKTYSPLYAVNRFSNPFFYKPFCIKCSVALLDYFFSQYDEITAMRHWCCETNTYWNIEIFNKAKEARIEDNFIKPFHFYYSKYIDKTKSFWDSPFIQEQESKIIEVINYQGNENKEVENWEKDAIEAKRLICKIYRYDPFEYEKQESKKRLYINLSNMLTPEIEDDPLKLNGAVQVARGMEALVDCDREFAQLNQLRVEQEENKKNINSKEFIDYEKKIDDNLKRKKNIQNILTNQFKDNGFDAKSKHSSIRGKGTLTYTLSHMTKEQYEPSLSNYLGVLGSKAMQEIAETSLKAAITQFNLTDEDVMDMITETRKKYVSTVKELNKTKENLRKAYYIIEKKKLIEEAQKAGIILDELGVMDTFEGEAEFD